MAALADYQRSYEALAAEDAANPLVPVDYLWAAAARLAARLGEVRDLDVCDLGCGRGILARILAESGARVTAVDIAVQHIAALSSGRVRAIAADADNLPFEQEFDIITATDVMEHTLRPGGFLYSVNRALKRGGRLFVRVPYRENLLAYAPAWCGYEYAHLRSYNRTLLRETLRGAGFRVEREWIDGYSLQTPRRWFINSRLGNRYNRWAEWMKKKGRTAADVPAWLAPLLMKPQEITVKAVKVQDIRPAEGGTLYRLI